MRQEVLYTPETKLWHWKINKIKKRFPQIWKFKTKICTKRCKTQKENMRVQVKSAEWENKIPPTAHCHTSQPSNWKLMLNLFLLADIFYYVEKYKKIIWTNVFHTLVHAVWYWKCSQNNYKYDYIIIITFIMSSITCSQKASISESVIWILLFWSNLLPHLKFYLQNWFLFIPLDMWCYLSLHISFSKNSNIL